MNLPGEAGERRPSAEIELAVGPAMVRWSVQPVSPGRLAIGTASDGGRVGWRLMALLQ